MIGPNEGAMSYEVGSAARLAGVTVRTLHHYDQIGLLRPSDRTPAGYRRYDEADLERLGRILFYRELGFDLERIRKMLDGETIGLDHLRRQHGLLKERIARLEGMVRSVEKAMEAQAMGISLTPEERLEIFGGFDPDEHAAEAERSWGDTDAYRESRRRASAYSKADWQRHAALSKAIDERLARALAAGLPTDGEEAMAAAEAHRALIDDWFYPCSPEMHIGLAEMYVSDPRFTATFEQLAPGLARYLHDAIVANARQRGGAG
jgi:MerR family transcriptional regulator, thiopeptide resistance regulator